MIALCLVTLALADPGATVVEAGDPAPSEGVHLVPGLYRRYVADSRIGAACEVELEAARQRVIDARRTVIEELDAADDGEEQLLVTVRELGERLDQRERQLARVRAQRMVLAGVVAGVVTGVIGAIAVR